MSASAVVTRGYGQGRRYLPTLGFSSADAAVYSALASAIRSLVAGLSLSGSPAVSRLLLPTDRAAAGVGLPCVLVTASPRGTRPIGTLSSADDWESSYLLTALQAGNQSLAWDDAWMGWREAITYAIHNRPLTGTVAHLVQVQPASPFEAGLAHEGNLLLGQLLVRARWRRDRGAAPSGGTPSGSANFSTAAQAVQAVIQGLGLTGIGSGQVYLLKLPSDRAAAGVTVASGTPVVLVSTAGQGEAEVGPLVGSDDWTLPVAVTLLKVANQDDAWDDQWFTWLEQVSFAFHNRRLPGMSSVFRCTVEVRTAVDGGSWQQRNLKMGQLVIRPTLRRVRT